MTVDFHFFATRANKGSMSAKEGIRRNLALDVASVFAWSHAVVRDQDSLNGLISPY